MDGSVSANAVLMEVRVGSVRVKATLDDLDIVFDDMLLVLHPKDANRVIQRLTDEGWRYDFWHVLYRRPPSRVRALAAGAH
jgi:hypothetical protein